MYRNKVKICHVKNDGILNFSRNDYMIAPNKKEDNELSIS